MAERKSPWGQTDFEVGDCRYWQIGPLGFWVRRAELEWQLAEQRCEEAGLVVAAEKPEPPEDASWIRWASGEVNPPVRIRPLTPDRPVVVLPAQPFRILKGGKARVYISIPLWVRVELAVEDDPLPLIDLPTVQMSNTWFGTLFEGSLCYWTETSARRSCSDYPSRPHVAVAPMFIHNRVQEELPLEKVCLRTAHLSLYSSESGLWASEVRVTNTGPGAPERIEVSEGAPEEAGDAELIAEPREKPRGGVLARTFDLISSLPGLQDGLAG